MSAEPQDTGYSMSVGTCVRCAQPSLLVGPLHGERGGPLVCIPCGSKVFADIRRHERRVKLRERWFDLEMANLTEREPSAAEDELCAETLEDALRLCHPDRHPPERREVADRVTRELLVLRPYVLPRAKPRDVSVVVTPPEKREPVTSPDPSTALAKIPQYPCALCKHTVPMYYCAVCRARWEEIWVRKRETERQQAERDNARARERRAQRRAGRRWQWVGCGEVFRPTRTDSRYCSRACRQRAYRERVTDKQRGRRGPFNQPSHEASGSSTKVERVRS